jgi:hypothetical protein
VMPSDFWRKQMFANNREQVENRTSKMSRKITRYDAGRGLRNQLYT